LLDKKNRRLLLKAEVVLQRGALEMLCCLKRTKEHESILALDAEAFVVHSGLLALGARPGEPVRFAPEFQPPRGQRIEIFLNWTDASGGAHREPARRWVRETVHRYWTARLDQLPPGLNLPRELELKYDQKHKELLWYGPMSEEQKRKLLALSDNEEFRRAISYFHERGQSREMKADWVFAGSGFHTDEETGKKFYQAEEGDLICVANFPGAMIDVAVQSSAEGQELAFEAFTERIPEKGTEVIIELLLAKVEEPAAPSKKN
jgi:hypothetical protein